MVYLTLLFALHCRPEGVPSQVLWPSAPAETEPPENQKSISRTAFSLWYRRARLPGPHLLFPSSGPDPDSAFIQSFNRHFVSIPGFPHNMARRYPHVLQNNFAGGTGADPQFVLLLAN